MKEKKEKELPAEVETAPPEITLRGRHYKFQDLTVEQMEIVSEMLDDARSKAREEFLKNAEGLNAVKNLTVDAVEIFNALLKGKKLSKFLAAVMTEQPDCEPFQTSDIHARTADFATCPYENSQEIFGYFFRSGKFWSLVFPNFSPRNKVGGDKNQESLKN